ncbi:MAG: hypothetical protein IH983_12030 [Planctomycetes bacterium]|nr:hypothetical protein [Planctomycetota bacterium]
MGVSALWPSDPGHNGSTFFPPGKAATPGSFLSSLSLRFVGHSSHHAALDRFCELSDTYHDEHGMSVTEAASHAHTGVLFEYSRRVCWISQHKGFNLHQVAAAVNPEVLVKLPAKPLAPLEQYRFVFQPLPQKKSRKGRQQQEAGCDG